MVQANCEGCTDKWSIPSCHWTAHAGYKFAIWVHGAWEVIKQDAMHLNDEDAPKLSRRLMEYHEDEKYV